MYRWRTYDGVVVDGVGLAPAGHDEGVIVGEEDDVVDALGLELVLVLDEGGKVGGRAGGGEGAGNGDDDDLLVGELYYRVSRMNWGRGRQPGGGGEERRTSRGLVVLGDAAGLDALDLGGVWDVREGDVLGERGSGLELSHFGGCDVEACVKRSCWNYR